jgi:Acetyl/propionyl-CoA carboxylase, alpha subunit
MFKKILIANRGEIAIRIMATCHEMGIRSVAVYSTADAHAQHVLAADEAYEIGPAPAQESYLHIPTIIAVAQRSGAEAIHPGYGFLSENAAFAEACNEAGLVFIGPSPESIRLMGSKIAAKNLARTVGAPLVPGYDGEQQDPETLYQAALTIGFPLLIKASAGGGGKGMRIVSAAENFHEQLAGARREAQAAFGDDTIFLERYLQQPHHIEFQILADHDGRVIHLNERECSIQRRHQKILEESPSTTLSPALREQMGATAIAIAHAAHYVNAGTIEFIVDQQHDFYFLEMNTRLQVEHPVTELITGLDLVRQQLLIAAGEPLSLQQTELQPRGHAIEVRIYAEDPEQQYFPSTGTITTFETPASPGVRLDSGVRAGDEVTQYYDPMLAKLITYGEDREACIARLQQTLAHSAIFGVTTNLPLLYAISQHPAFLQGETYTNFIEQHGLTTITQTTSPLPAVVLYFAALATLSPQPSYPSNKQPSASDQYTPWQTLGPWRTIGEAYQQTYRYQERLYRIALQPERTRAASWWISIDDQPAQLVTSLHDQRNLPQNLLSIEHAGCHSSAYVDVTQNNGITVAYNGYYYHLQRRQPPDIISSAHSTQSGNRQNTLKAPMTGTVVKIYARNGDIVEAHQILLVLAAMKMEHTITAPYAGTVQGMHYEEGSIVQGGSIVAEILSRSVSDQ